MKLWKNTVPVMIICIGLIFLWGGCAKPPTAEMEAAEAALMRAENDPDAALYGESSLIRARDAFEWMKSEAESKRYDSAKSYAAETIAASERAISDGRAFAARTRDEAAGLVANLKQSLGETQNALDNAKQVQDSALDFETLDRDIDAARHTVDQVEVAVAGTRYQEAREKGQNARAALSNIMARLSDGVRVATRKK